MYKSIEEMAAVWESKEYQARVLELEAEGLTTSNAQGATDVEVMTGKLIINQSK